MLRDRGLTKGAGPEHNLVQNPALTRALQQVSGLRQAHAVPVIGDTLQSVVIADDVRDYPQSGPITFAAFRPITGDGIGPVSGMLLVNQPSSQVAARILQVSIYAQTVGGDVSFAVTDCNFLGLGTAPSMVGGSRLVGGAPSVGRTDLPPSLSQSGNVGTRPRNGTVVSPYFWSRPQGWTEDEVLFRANGESFVLLPGGVFVVEIIDANSTAYVNFLWNEYPL